MKKKKAKAEEPRCIPILQGKELDLQEQLSELFYTNKNQKIKMAALNLHCVLWPDVPIGHRQLLFIHSEPFKIKRKGVKK